MKKIIKTISLLLLSGVSLVFVACQDGAETPTGSATSENSQEERTAMTSEEAADAIVADYLKLTTALADSNQKDAAKIGGDLLNNLKQFDKSGYSTEEQQELADIIEDAMEHADHISYSELDHQREHFDILSKDMIDMVAITGTDRKLYQYYCPMYDDDRGASWLSASKEIRNPYFGSAMMACGELQREIN